MSAAARAEASPGAPRWRPAVWVLVFLAAFVLRARTAFEYSAHHPQAALLSIDEEAYDTWAQELAAGSWAGDTVYFQEPLYAHVLGLAYALVGRDLLFVRLAQALLGALTCVLAGRLAERLFGRGAGLAAGTLLALHGPLLLFPCFLLKENLLLPLLALLATLLVATRESARPRLAWCGVGVLAGLGALLKGNVLVLLPLLALWPLWRARRPFGAAAAAGGCVLLGAFLVLAPVLLRNRAVGGEWVLTTSQLGTNAYAGNNAENPYGRAMEVSFVRGIPAHEADDWRREAERRSGRALGPAEVSAFWRDRTLEEFAAAPAQGLLRLARKLALSLGGYEVPDNHFYEWDRGHLGLLRLPWPGFALLGGLALAGLGLLVAHRRRAAPGWGELAAFGAAYLATIVLTVTSDRARLPLVLVAAPFAGALLAWLIEDVRARATARAVRTLLLAAAACALLALPVVPAAERAEDFDERDFNLATQWARDPARRAEARALTAALLQRHPNSVRTQLLAAWFERMDLGTRLADDVASARRAAQEQLAEGVRRLEELEALPALPARERFRVQLERGSWETLRGEPAAAASAFRRALEFDDRSLEAWRGLAAALTVLLERGSAAPATADELASALQSWRGLARTAHERAELELCAARAALPLASADQAGGRRAAAEQRVQAALRALQPYAGDATLPPELRMALRRQAGRIQLHVGTPAALASAERHFRAALELRPDADSQLGLAQTLISRAEREPPVAAALLAEIDALLAGLRARDAQSPALREAEVRRAALR